MSAESPFLRVRVSADLLAAIDTAGRRRKLSRSEFARFALAEAVGNPELAAMREPGRPSTGPTTPKKVVSQMPCQLCGWNDGPRDCHRATPGRRGGEYTFGNVYSLCPNCHRLVTLGIISDADLLKKCGPPLSKPDL